MSDLTERRQELARLWEEHVAHEFEARDPDATMRTMVSDAYVNHVPVLTGGSGYGELLEFYSNHFIPMMPSDTEMRSVSRTIGEDRLVDKFVFKFTHTVRMDWLVPGIEPTGRAVEIPMIVVVEFEGDKLAGERIYWDQAAVLVQLGLIEVHELPVTGVDSARKVLDPSLASNRLIRKHQVSTSTANSASPKNLD